MKPQNKILYLFSDGPIAGSIRSSKKYNAETEFCCLSFNVFYPLNLCSLPPKLNDYTFIEKGTKSYMGHFSEEVIKYFKTLSLIDFEKYSQIWLWTDGRASSEFFMDMICYFKGNLPLYIAMYSNKNHTYTVRPLDQAEIKQRSNIYHKYMGKPMNPKTIIDGTIQEMSFDYYEDMCLKRCTNEFTHASSIVGSCLILDKNFDCNFYELIIKRLVIDGRLVPKHWSDPKDDYYADAFGPEFIVSGVDIRGVRYFCIKKP